MSNEIAIPIKINDEDIKKLEKIKQLLMDIKEIDNEFKISNVININDNTTLIFKCESAMVKREHLKEMSEVLSKELNCKCVILDSKINLDKAIKRETKEDITYVDNEVYIRENIPPSVKNI